MSTSDEKVMQYLNEAHATELALVRVLQSQIAMAPRGSYREGLERHLDETRDHAERVRARLEELGEGGTLLTGAVGVVETVIGQALALGKAPFDLLRGSGGEEKVLKNAKDACATEALEIATYTALERLAALRGRRHDRAARRVDPRRRGAHARPRAARDPEAHRGRRRRRRARRAELSRRRDRSGRRRPRGRRERQADGPPGPQGARRRPRRGTGQGRGGLRAGPRDQPLRLAHGRRDHRPPRRASRRSTSPRSPPTSASTRTAPPCSAASTPSRATSRGRGMTS